MRACQHDVAAWYNLHMSCCGFIGPGMLLDEHHHMCTNIYDDQRSLRQSVMPPTVTRQLLGNHLRLLVVCTLQLTPYNYESHAESVLMQGSIDVRQCSCMRRGCCCQLPWTRPPMRHSPLQSMQHTPVSGKSLFCCVHSTVALPHITGRPRAGAADVPAPCRRWPVKLRQQPDHMARTCCGCDVIPQSRGPCVRSRASDFRDDASMETIGMRNDV